VSFQTDLHSSSEHEISELFSVCSVLADAVHVNATTHACDVESGN